MRQPGKRVWLILAAVDLAALALVGCSGGGLNTLSPGPLPYQYSNAIMPQGFSESVIGPDRYRIEVKGPL
ncbi:MAG TPA: hypothetical protein VEA77_03400, partial [Hyphomicrobium sp.]|nr:hypothetical protein [Hyphomicrobium sp.]